jgi:hypothetical protein
MAIDSSGEVWVTDRGGNTVGGFAPTGSNFAGAGEVRYVSTEVVRLRIFGSEFFSSLRARSRRA